jgi:hypothetical protein
MRDNRSGRMSDSITVDAVRLPLLLGELRLPTVAKRWQTFTQRACSATSAGGAAATGQDPRPESPHVALQPAHVAQHRTDQRSVRHDFRRIVPKGAALELV